MLKSKIFVIRQRETKKPKIKTRVEKLQLKGGFN